MSAFGRAIQDHSPQERRHLGFEQGGPASGLPQLEHAQADSLTYEDQSPGTQSGTCRDCEGPRMVPPTGIEPVFAA